MENITPHLMTLLNKFSESKLVNIGSGPKPWLGWHCLDQVTAPGITYCAFSNDCLLPFNNEEFELVYSSHCFEHLEDGTVSQLLSEANRILKNNGKLVVKLPDFDWFLKEYRNNNISSMEDMGFESILWSWKNYQVEDTILNRVSMMFCGYWNHAYGDHFSHNIKKSADAYHGPAKINQKELVKLFKSGSAREITKHLRARIAKDRDFKEFNHQNSWSLYDFVELLKRHDFNLISAEKDYSISSFKKIIPDIASMVDFSMYFVANKK